MPLHHARNHLGTLGEAKSFLRTPKFYIDSIYDSKAYAYWVYTYYFKLRPTHFSRGKIFPGVLSPTSAPLVTGLCYTLYVCQCLECWSCWWTIVPWRNYRFAPGGN